MPWLKNEAPANIVALVDKIETTADASVEAFSLRGTPSNIGLWALLADGIRRTEDGNALYVSGAARNGSSFGGMRRHQERRS